MLHNAFVPGLVQRPLPAYLRKQKDRLFVGVLLDSYTGLRVSHAGQQFCHENNIQGTLRGRHLLHISLHHVGDYYGHLPSRMVFAAKRAAEAVSAPACEVTLNSIVTFPHEGAANHPTVFLAESAGLVGLHRGMGAAMRRIGLSPNGHFRPHVTFLYGPDVVPKQPIEPIRFTVKEFALIHSEVGLSKYNVIDRWTLNSAQ